LFVIIHSPAFSSSRLSVEKSERLEEKEGLPQNGDGQNGGEGHVRDWREVKEGGKKEETRREV